MARARARWRGWSTAWPSGRRPRPHRTTGWRCLRSRIARRHAQAPTGQDCRARYPDERPRPARTPPVVPSSGRVLVDGLDTRNQVKDVRRRVGFVFQNPENQIVFPIVREDLAFGLKKQGLAPAERDARIAAALERLGVGHLAERTSHTLSGGERQLVAMASVLVMAPQLVVFDEPTTQLDLRNRNRVAEAIAALPQQAIVVSHDLDLLAGYDRVLAVVDGRIAADGEPAAVLGWYREHCA
ncbi:ABC transporter, ATP-binding protein [Bordetella bronchiseptica D989]|nr:ABC transporter, ATP-binding protein [Bordetella bronchiseptica D989]